jgi:hypothetical protein
VCVSASLCVCVTSANLYCGSGVRPSSRLSTSACVKAPPSVRDGVWNRRRAHRRDVARLASLVHRTKWVGRGRRTFDGIRTVTGGVCVCVWVCVCVCFSVFLSCCLGVCVCVCFCVCLSVCGQWCACGLCMSAWVCVCLCVGAWVRVLVSVLVQRRSKICVYSSNRLPSVLVSGKSLAGASIFAWGALPVCP